MASGARHSKKRDLDERSSNDLPRKRISPSAKQNMKEGNNFSQDEFVSGTNRILTEHSAPNSQKLFKVVYCKRKAQNPTLSPTYKKKQLPENWGCEMANEENEIAVGNLHDKFLNERRHFALNSSDSSQTEGPSSKYSSFFAEVSKDHETMTRVLFSRNLRLNVALTFWRKRSVNEFVAYLVRMQDLGVLVDCLPVLTNSIQEDRTVSVGCCVDLLPLVKSLLKSTFEEYVSVGLNWLQAVVKRWWTQLAENSENPSDE
ncbi:hypothetical protein GDO86_016384 [Hymenochirus boettgeri]|nr:hypothetical protein GDO86_016384 [Hymenochirus boettgeri]